VQVRRAWVLARPTRRTGQRILNHLSFSLSSIPRTLGVPRPDVVFVNSPPLFLAASAVVVGRLRRVPVVLCVADLHPESAIALGMLPPGPPRWLAWRIADLTYRAAAGIVALTEGIAAGVRARGVSPAKVRVIRAGGDMARFGPDVPTDWRARQGLTDGFVALYAGLFGSTQGVTTIRDAAARLTRADKVRVVLVGDGPLGPSLAEGISETLTILPPEPPERMPEVLAAADAAIVSLADLPLMRGALPAKLFEAMASGKPVVLAAPEGEATALVREHGCGLVVPPQDPDAMAAAIRDLATDRPKASAMGAAGRRAAESEYSREAMAARVRAYLSEVAGGS
jgi:glycosyltransferase involved in cell wall biosynthesis